MHYDVIVKTGLEASADKIGYSINKEDFNTNSFLFNYDKKLNTEFANLSDILWGLHNHKDPINSELIFKFDLFNQEFQYIGEVFKNNINLKKLKKIYKKYYEVF